DTNHQTRFKLTARIPFPVIGYLGLFVQLKPNAGSHQLSYNAISVADHMVLHGVSNITHALAGNGLCYAQMECLQSYTKQLIHLCSYFAHSKCIGRVTNVAIQINTTVDRNNVSITKFIVTGNTMHHLVVDRYAQGVGKPVVIEKCGAPTMVMDIIMRQLI